MIGKYLFALKASVLFLIVVLMSGPVAAQSATFNPAGCNHLNDDFETFKARLIRFNDRINQTEDPSKTTIDSLVDQYNKLMELNKNYLSERYTVDTSEQGLRESYFNFLSSSVTEAHAGLEIKEEVYGYCWPEIVKYYSKIALNTDDNDDFIFYCDEMISVLNDGHTWVSFNNNPAIKSLGIGFEKTEGDFRIKAFYNGIEAGRLKLGDKIKAIDGIAIGKLYDSIKQFTIYKDYPEMEIVYDKRFFRSYYFYAMRNNLTDSATVVFENAAGEDYSIDLKWYPARYIRNMYGVRISRDKKTGIESKILEGNYGYIKIDQWNPDFIAEFNNIFREMKNSSGIIIDIRNNFGGDYTNFGQTILGKFLSEDTTTMYKRFRNSTLYHRYGFMGLHYQSDETYEEPYYPLVPVKLVKENEEIYDNPVVLLVNQKHFSSTDLFILAFHELEIGTIIGRLNRFQLSGQALSINSPWNEWKFGISVMMPYTMNKNLYEEKHLQVDIEIPLTEAEIYGREDPILEAALDYLKR